MSAAATHLPIDGALPALLEALRAHGSVVLRAPTGAGKTTRVPPAVLDAGLAGAGQVVVLEPRRVAARAAARRIAAERGHRLGREVGYQVRFDRVAGPSTRLLIVTEGILLRVLQRDPFLEGIGALVFDEFHERRLDSDLALAMARRIQTDVRPDLKLVVMSATLEPGPLAAFLGDCPIVDSAGRQFPVSIDYLPRRPEARLPELAARGVRQVGPDADGDVLVFLPGVGEIRRTERILRRDGPTDRRVVTLYGALPAEEQDAVLSPTTRDRRVILATNVAETSVTIPGVCAVVDAGYVRAPRFDAGCGLNRLELTRISRASAEQRAGRAGRTGPGRALRLWTRGQQAELLSRDVPEVRRIDVTEAVLQLLVWGESDPAAFDWFEAPEPASLERALELLDWLGARDGRGLTDLGRAMARLPTAPRLGRLVLESARLGASRSGALLAALLAERDPFGRHWPPRRWTTDSDVLDRLTALQDALAGRPIPGERPPSRAALRRIEHAAAQLASRAGADGAAADGSSATRESLGRALLAAYPDRLARRRDSETASTVRGVLVGGRGVQLAESSGVTDSNLFLCVDLDAGRRRQRTEAIVWRASAVEPTWLPPDALDDVIDVRFDAATERVIATNQTRYRDLVLSEQPARDVDQARLAAVLAAAATVDPDSALGLDRPQVQDFLRRLRWLGTQQPELGLPQLAGDELVDALPQLCFGRSSFAELRQIGLDELLAGRLDYNQRRQLDALAPERLEVPSGSRIRLRYRAGEPPVLAVRIQELFGLDRTPCIAAGRVPVLLHLLAPNQRPQQVTDDLASFWRHTYPEVRKELRARYPKHAWPEDPLAAKPRRRPVKKRRKK